MATYYTGTTYYEYYDNSGSKQQVTYVFGKSSTKGEQVSLTRPAAPSKPGFTFQHWGDSSSALPGTTFTRKASYSDRNQDDVHSTAKWTGTIYVYYNVGSYYGTYWAHSGSMSNYGFGQMFSEEELPKVTAHYTVGYGDLKNVYPPSNLVVPDQIINQGGSETQRWYQYQQITHTGWSPYQGSSSSSNGVYYTGSNNIMMPIFSQGSTYTEYEYLSIVEYYVDGALYDRKENVHTSTGFTDYYTMPTAGKKTGYNFKGWSTSPSATSAMYSPGQSVAVGNQKLTLYAVYEKIQWTITYDNAGHGIKPSNKTVDDNWKLTANDLPTLSEIGWKFLGWYKGDAKISVGNTVKENLSLVAHWETDYCYITYDNNGHGVITFDNPKTLIAGHIITTDDIPVLTAPGYSWGGWYSNNQRVLTGRVITTDETFIARWNELEYLTIHYEAYPGTPPPDKTDITKGYRLTKEDLPDLPDVGDYKFSHWTLDGAQVPVGYEVIGNITLTAVWLEKHTITYTSQYDIGNIPPDIIYWGDSYQMQISELPTLHSVGQRFEGWYDGDNLVDAGYRCVGNRTLEARWIPVITYNITYETEYGTAPDSIFLEENSLITANELPKLTATGYRFNYWKLNGLELKPDTYRITSNITLVADWDVGYYLSYETDYVDPPEQKMVYGRYSITREDLPRLQVDDHVFIGWTLDGEIVRAGQVITEATRLIASWRDAVTIRMVYETEHGITPSYKIIEPPYTLTEEDLPDLQATGYLFNGWYYGEDKAYPGMIVGEDSSVSSISLIANWEEAPVVEVYKAQDIHIQDVDLQREYTATYLDGEVETAHAIYNDNSQLFGKGMMADIFNQIINGILISERQYINDVPTYLDNLTARLQNGINNLINLGDWDIDETYRRHNIVYKDDLMYYHKASSSIGVDPEADTEENIWVKLGLRGDSAPVNLGVNYQGNWSSTVSYNMFDMVSYGNDLYVAKQDNVGENPSRGMMKHVTDLTGDGISTNYTINLPAEFDGKDCIIQLYDSDGNIVLADAHKITNAINISFAEIVPIDVTYRLVVIGTESEDWFLAVNIVEEYIRVSTNEPSDVHTGVVWFKVY